MGSSLLSLFYFAACAFWLYAQLTSCEVHNISNFNFSNLKINVNSSLNEEFPENINFEFQSMNNTFIFWLQRRGGLIGDVSRVITHRGDEAKNENTKVKGRPYSGYRMLVLEGNKEDSKVLDDIENPIARFFAYKS